MRIFVVNAREMNISVHCQSLTYGVTQGKVIALSSKDGIQACLAVSALWTGHHQSEHAHQRKHCHLCK